MLREGWNFHGDIAIPLEGTASSHYGRIGRPMGTIYDADAIDVGTFVEVMIILLRERTDMADEIEGIDEFVRECSPYLGMSGNLIPKETAQRLFDKFNDLYA